MKIRMKYRKETKGTFVFEEVTEDGKPVEQVFAKIPTLYIRKSALKQAAQYITVEVLSV